MVDDNNKLNTFTVLHFEQTNQTVVKCCPIGEMNLWSMVINNIIMHLDNNICFVIQYIIICAYILPSTYQCLNLELLSRGAQSNDLKSAFEVPYYLIQTRQYKKVIR